MNWKTANAVKEYRKKSLIVPLRTGIVGFCQALIAVLGGLTIYSMQRASGCIPRQRRCIVLFTRRHPPSLDFPGVEITAIHQTGPIAPQLAGAARSKPTGQDMAQSPRLQLGIIGPNARFTVMFNYEAKRHEPMDTKDVKEEDIENTVAEFLEAVIAGEARV
jgi:hypothetical protein